MSDGERVVQVNLLLAIYRQNKLPGDFKVEQANGMLYVTPTKVLGTSGALREVISLMLTPVTIPYANRSASDTADAIWNAVYKATGLRIAIGDFPFWPTDAVSFGVNGEPARDALAKLFAQAAPSKPLSYRLLFDPRTELPRPFDYMLNVHATAPASNTSATPIAPELPPNRPGDRPGVTRDQQ